MGDDVIMKKKIRTFLLLSVVSIGVSVPNITTMASEVKEVQIKQEVNDYQMLERETKIINISRDTKEKVINSNFRETPQEIVNKMKNDLLESKNSTINEEATRALSSLMAIALNKAGFNNSADLLNYSMLPLRDEPREFNSQSNISNDIWLYSPDFERVATNFLWTARANNSYEYFASTTMNFTMPNANKAQILANTQLKKQTDLFGALHAVNIHLGIVKTGLQWDMLILIEDTYDFKSEQYNSLVNIVNDIAHHDQELGNIKPYLFYITADRPYLNRPPFGVPAW